MLPFNALQDMFWCILWPPRALKDDLIFRALCKSADPCLHGSGRVDPVLSPIPIPIPILYPIILKGMGLPLPYPSPPGPPTLSQCSARSLTLFKMLQRLSAKVSLLEGHPRRFIEVAIAVNPLTSGLEDSDAPVECSPPAITWTCPTALPESSYIEKYVPSKRFLNALGCLCV